MPTPSFPSDLDHLPEDTRGTMTVAGRVMKRESGSVWLADAYVTVRLGGDVDVEVGDLAVLSVDRGALRVLAVLERHRPLAQSRDEQARFVEGGVGRNLRARADVIAKVRAFFAVRRFVEIDTPILVPSPGLDLHLDAVEATGGFLITSPEYQMKRLLTGGVPRVFQIAHVFRQGEVGARHNPEFAMLEWYRAFAGVEDVMRDTEDLVAEVLPSAVRPFLRLGVEQAFARFAGVASEAFFAMAEHDQETFFRILVDQVEPALATTGRPLFLVDYPLSQASLARAKPGDPRVCERFELYVDGIELCNGFGELTDPIEQRRRLLTDQTTRRTLGKPVYPIDDKFVAALEEGMPPSAGNALGIDRLVALALGEREIARVLPFPAGVL